MDPPRSGDAFHTKKLIAENTLCVDNGRMDNTQQVTSEELLVLTPLSNTSAHNSPTLGPATIGVVQLSASIARADKGDKMPSSWADVVEEGKEGEFMPSFCKARNKSDMHAKYRPRLSKRSKRLPVCYLS